VARCNVAALHCVGAPSPGLLAALAIRPLPARGERSIKAISFSRCVCIRVLPVPARTTARKTFCLPHMREAERRKAPTSQPRCTFRCRHLKVLRTGLHNRCKPSALRGCAPRMLRFRESSACGRARLPALHRGFRRRANAFESVKAALHAIRRARALSAPLTALKPSTWLAGRHAGGDDARTARERSVSLRPREPPSLHFREYPRPKGPSQIQ
jgi:hypothetical protein